MDPENDYFLPTYVHEGDPMDRTPPDVDGPEARIPDVEEPIPDVDDDPYSYINDPHNDSPLDFNIKVNWWVVLPQKMMVLYPT